MKCKICERYFVSETKFFSLFQFLDICPNCKELYKPVPKLEVFPIDNGIVKYYYLYDDIPTNKKQRDYLEQNIKYLITSIQQEDYSILIIVDDLIYTSLKNDFKYLLKYKNILLVSVFRFSFEYFVFF